MLSIQNKEHDCFGVSIVVFEPVTQLTFTCSKSTIQTLEKSIKYVQSKQWENHNDVTDFILVLLLLALKIFYAFSSVSIVDFDQVNVG